MEWAGPYAIFIPVYAFLLLPIVSALHGNATKFLTRVAETQWGLIITVFCVCHVPAIMNLNIAGHGDRAMLVVTFLVMVVQLGDLLAYFFGRQIGRIKIAAGLSPKTWEGLACGVGSTMIIGGLLNWITPFGVQGAMVTAGAASLVGMFGNLVFAAIKRERDVKDWSHLIPRQGGLSINSTASFSLRRSFTTSPNFSGLSNALLPSQVDL